ncbi:MAG: hypothetical protein EOP51_32490, partial [Sphingobacteriales bacterium]
GLVERGAGLTNTNNKNNDYNNRISDLNPNDIETITVLKGPEATALYGSQASSGAIVITTKKPTSTKLAVQYDNNFRLQFVTRQPEIFDEYTNGTNGNYDVVFRYYGPKYAPNTKKYDNIDQFFKTGYAQTHNLGLDFGVKNSMFRVSGSAFDQSGIIPTNNYKRYTARVSNTTRFGKWMDISPAVQYSSVKNDKVLRGAGGFLLGLLSWPTTDDITGASRGNNSSKDPIFAASPNSEFDNPLFNVANNKSRDVTERVNTSLGVNIRPTEWLSLAGRFGYEHYKTEGYLRYHPLSYYVSAALGGIQDNNWRQYNGYNHTITATAKKTVAKDFNFRLMVGTMWQDYKTEMFSITGTGLIDSIVNGVMYKAGNPVTNANYGIQLGALTDSSVTKPSTRIRLLRNLFNEYN